MNFRMEIACGTFRPHVSVVVSGKAVWQTFSLLPFVSVAISIA